MKTSMTLGLQQWSSGLSHRLRPSRFHVPVHTWLPDAHVEAPTAGSVILAAVLLKMGLTGSCAFRCRCFPKHPWIRPSYRFWPCSPLSALLRRSGLHDAEGLEKADRLFSVSHLGFCTLGIFSMNPNGIAGSVLQQLNHGISTGMLFMVIGVVYERRHTREIRNMAAWRTSCRSSPYLRHRHAEFRRAALLNGFVGEFTILTGAFEANRIWAAFAVTGVILGAAYLLWLYQRTMLGQVTNGKNLVIPDMNFREVAMFVPLIAWAVWIGVYPKPYFDILRQPGL